MEIRGLCLAMFSSEAGGGPAFSLQVAWMRVATVPISGREAGSGPNGGEALVENVRSRWRSALGGTRPIGP